MQEQKKSAFLMFNGQAEEEMNYYVSLFDGSEIKHVFHHEDGRVLHAAFTLKDQTFMAIDDVNKSGLPLRLAMSLFVECDSGEGMDRLYTGLSEGGMALTPLGPSPVSEKFAWVQDKFGVSWQLNLAKG